MSLTITELVAYFPAEDFELSKRFYEALGFSLAEGFGGTMVSTSGSLTPRR